MADNPIKYSDFIQPDDSITSLIAQLTALDAKYSEMLGKVKADAATAEASLKKASGATEEGTEAIKKGATEAEKLAKANEGLNKSRTENAKQLTVLKAKQQEQNNVNKLTAKLNSSVKGSYDKLSAQYSLNKIKLNKLSAEQRSAGKAGNKLETDTKALYEEMKRLQENTGKTSLNVGNYGAALGAVPGPAGAAVQGTKAMGKQLMILAANPIVAMLVLIVATVMLLAKAMTRSEEGQNRLNKVMTVASSIFDNIMDIFTAMGIALFDTLPAIFKRFGIVFTKTFKKVELGLLIARRLWNKWTGDSEEADKLTKAVEKTRKELAALNVEQAKLTEEIQKSFDGAIKKVRALGSEIKKDIAAAIKLADAEAKFNRDERKYLIENAKLNTLAAKARREAEALKLLDARASIEAMKASFKMDEKVLANELNLAKQRESILKQTSALAVDDIEAKKEIAEAEAKIFDLETRFEELRRQRTRRLNMIRKESLKQEKERSKTLIKIGQLEQAEVIRKNKTIIASDESAHDAKHKALLQNAQLSAQVLRDSSALELAELKGRKDLKLISDKDYSLQKKLIELKLKDDILKISEGLAKQQAKINKKKTVVDKKEAKATYDIQLKGIDAQRSLALSEIDLLKTTEAEKTRLRLQAEKDRLKAILELNKAGGAQLSKTQLAIIANTIKKIDREMKSTAAKDYDIYSLAGLNLDDEKKEAINVSTQFAIDQLGQFLSAKIAAADAAVANSDREVAAAQNTLEAEIEARNNGYAFNVVSAQKELNLAKKNQAKALKEQEKAQKAQLVMDSVMQASSLVLASAKIWGQLGFPWAIPALAVMWGSFAFSKIKAFQVTKQKKTYADGGLEFLEGGSHASGNDIALGITSDGKDRRAEGGEAMAIFKKSMTSKYRHLLPGIVDSLNKGVFEKKYMGAYEMSGMQLNVVSQGSDLTGLESDVNAIKRQGERSFFVDGQGRLIETYKNLKIIYNT
jgi:hypothetical protein